MDFGRNRALYRVIILFNNFYKNMLIFLCLQIFHYRSLKCFHFNGQICQVSNGRWYTILCGQALTTLLPSIMHHFGSVYIFYSILHDFYLTWFWVFFRIQSQPTNLGPCEWLEVLGYLIKKLQIFLNAK